MCSGLLPISSQNDCHQKRKKKLLTLKIKPCKQMVLFILLLYFQLFVKGLVNQEQQQEVSYPGVLHCVFCGARGLFMDSLIRSTSANIVVSVPSRALV